MRTLKKTLCLVLALVMMLGLCVINVAATSFPDDDKITADYREALEVITGLGIITGKEEGGNIIADPQGTMTRVQGCYYITRMLDADVPETAVSQFSDVTNGTKDAAVIEWVVNNGYASGNGDGTFEPYAPMKGMHFAKWLLTALGYDAEKETLTGPNWEGGVRLLTAKEGLSKGIRDYDQNAVITREEAAQMCLNTLESTMMYYPYGGTVAVGGGSATLAVATPVANNSGISYKASDPTDRNMEFVEMYFPKLKKNDRVANANGLSTEDLNTPLKWTWNYKGEELYKALATPVVSYSTKVDATDVSADLSDYYIVKAGATGDTDRIVRANQLYVNNATTYYSNATNTNAVVTVNGAAATDVAVANQFTIASRAIQFTGTSGMDKHGTTLAGAIASLTEKGRTVDVYATDPDYPNEINHIIVTCYTVAKVSKVSTSGGKTTYEFEGAWSKNDITNLSGIVYAEASADSTLYADNDALAKDDIVTLTSNRSRALTDGDTLFAYQTYKYSGTQTRYDTKNNVTISGTVYPIATGVSTTTDHSKAGGKRMDYNNYSSNTSVDVDYWLDQFGNLVYKKDIKKNDKYAFIVAAAGEDAKNGLDDGKPSISVRAVLYDNGEVVVGDYSVKVSKALDAATAYSSKKAFYPITATAAGKTAYHQSTMTRNTATKLWVIENTDIVVGADGTFTSDTATPDFTAADGVSANDAAKILMSAAYGYVYTYELKGTELELTPITKSAYTGTSDGSDKSYKFVGQTYEPLGSGKQNYESASIAVASDSKLAADNGTSGTFNAVKPAREPNVGSNKGDDTVVINDNTTVVIYDTDSKKFEIKTGVSGLPTYGTGTKQSSTESGVGYFVADGVKNSDRLNAKVVFIAKDKGISTSTAKKSIVYIDTSDYATDGTGTDDNPIIHTFNKVMGTDGKPVEGVKDGNKDLKDVTALKSGLYEIDANNVVIKQLFVADDADEAGDITADAPYFYIAEVGDRDNDENISGKTIDTGTSNKAEVSGDHIWYTDHADVVIVKKGGVLGKDAMFVIFEVSNNSLTSNVATIFVV